MTPSFIALPISSPNAPLLYERAAFLIRPPERLEPDEWGAKYRTYPPTSGRPGPRDPYLTPYAIPFGRDLYAGVALEIMACAAQMAKTEEFLDVIGARLDQRPTPILYVGPSKEFNTDQFEPRLMALLDEAPRLAGKVQRGRRMKKTRKVIAGVPVRLAHAGSSTALKSDPAGLALVDEYDEMMANIKGQGDPLGLVVARGFSYADFTCGVVSTPSQGHIETEKDGKTGLEFWRVAEIEDVRSPIWRLWQSGTRHHFCWQCPHCREYFVPRSSLLCWAEKATPEQALANAWVACPRCGGVIEESHKHELNRTGVFIAPGQTIDAKGQVTGTPSTTSPVSRWISGLCSPFVTFGKRASDYLTALATGEQAKIQTAVNAGFGECYLPGGGDLPEWQEIKRLCAPYRLRTLPEGVRVITAGVDVQADRLVVVVRGWGARGRSWLLDRTEILGDTAKTEVWLQLGEYLDDPIGPLPIKVMFIDSGFRPGKKDKVPEHRVYEFCRVHRRVAFPTKGVATARVPLRKSDIEPRLDGKPLGYGLRLYVIDSDHFKSAIHERLRYPLDAPAVWLLDQDADEHYLRQLVSEVRTVTPSGRPEWVLRSRQNHFLDAEALALAAAYLLGVQRQPEKAAKETPVRATKQASRATADENPREPKNSSKPAEPRVAMPDPDKGRGPLALRLGAKAAPANAPANESAFDRARRLSQQLNRR